jgi:hypothetical protein
LIAVPCETTEKEDIEQPFRRLLANAAIPAASPVLSPERRYCVNP